MENNTVVYINWDGFAKYYLDYAIDNNYKIDTIKQAIKEGVYFENAYTSIPSITNAMQPTIVSGTTPKYTDNHYRYFNKDKKQVIQENPKRINRAETIAEALSRQNLEIISINQFALEDRGAFKNDPKRPYISVPGKHGMKRFDYASNFVRTLNASGMQFKKMPRFIALYMDELDDLGHNDKIIHNIFVAKTEKERIETVVKGLELLDHKLGEFINTIKSLDLYDRFTFILTADHGMTSNGQQKKSGKFYPSSLGQLKNDLESIGHSVEVLKAGESQKHQNTDIVIVTVGLQVQLSYPKVIDRKEISDRNKIIIEHLKNKEYFGDYKETADLEKQGIKRGFADLLISPKIPYNFKVGKHTKYLRAKGQHDSLDSTSQRVPLIMWGNKVKENQRISNKIYVSSVAPTVAVLLDKNIPLDATSEVLYDQLLINKPKLNKRSKPFSGLVQIEKKVHRLDIKYKSNEDMMKELYVEGIFVRSIFFPKTFGDTEQKRINMTLNYNQSFELKSKDNKLSSFNFMSIEYHFMQNVSV